MNARPYLAALILAAITSSASAQFFFFGGDSGPGFSVFDDGYEPRGYDPYFNRPKVYREPVYYETKSVKKKGNKVTTKTKIKDQNGRVVYENKKTKTTKKKKK